MSPEEQAARGAHAQALLDDPLFKEAVGLLKDACLREIVNVPHVGIFPGQADRQRLAAQMKLQAVEAFVNVFAQAARDGSLAQYDLRHSR